jgi:hypothetical protein
VRRRAEEERMGDTDLRARDFARIFAAHAIACALYGATMAVALVMRMRDAFLGYEPLRGQVHPGIARLAEAERRIKMNN